VLPKVKSWRDTGETPHRENYREEAKLWLLHTPSPCITSPLYVKQRNQGSRAARRQLLPAQETQTTRWACGTPTNNPGPDQHSPLDRLTLTQGKKRKKPNWIINNNNNKKTHSKEGGAPWVPKRKGGAIPHRTVNKQAGQRRQEWWHTPSNLVEGKLVTVAVAPRRTLNKQSLRG
jgi:hypothetical protein